jgi:hypothetical protein
VRKIITYTLQYPLILIFVFSLFIRTVNLEEIPVGFHSDEARVAWNSLSLLKTGRDDWGNLLPLYYNTFGDYRPAAILYATIPSIMAFGRTVFAVRFPSALFGSLAIFPLAYIATHILKRKDTVAGVSAAFLWAITPWTIATSRATSEVVISTTIALTGLALFIHAFSVKKNNTKVLVAAFAILALSTFFYHTARILVPIYWVTSMLYFKKEIFKLHLMKAASICAISLLLLTIVFSFGQASRGRLAQVSILSTNVLGAKNERLQTKPSTVSHLFSISRMVTIQYTTYLSPQFLIGDIAKPVRYMTSETGLISVATSFLLIIGLCLIIKKKISSFPLVLLLISPLPAAITIEDTPNLHRAFFMLPFLLIIAAQGLASLKQKSVLFLPLLVISLLSFFGFLSSYFGTQSQDIATFRNGSAKEMALYLNEVKSRYSKVYVTNDPDSPYPWFAFFSEKDPNEFNEFAKKRTEGNWNYKNIIFTVARCPSAAALDKKSQELGSILVVDGYKCEADSIAKDHPEAKIKKEYAYPNGEIVYRLWERDAITNRK